MVRLRPLSLWLIACAFPGAVCAAADGTTPPPDPAERVIAAGSAADSASRSTPQESTASETTPPALPPRVVIEKRTYTGQVVRLSDALKRRGIRCGPEMDGHIVLETSNGRLYPILGDWRGRAFYQDERLRDRRVTLVAHRRSDLGYLQPLMVFTYDEQERPQFTDYWCDVCSIPMYELKPCECCQGEIRLRFTPQAPPADVPAANDSP